MRMRIFFVMVFFLLPLCSFAKVPKKILFLGDSITAGYGVAKADSFVGLIDKRWKEKYKDTQIVNAGVSGSTTASCVKRLKWQLKAGVDAVFIALGANDGLRGVPVESSKKNLDQCLQLAKDNKIKVIFAGMLLPKNYGEKYRKSFEAMFKELSQKHKPIFFPFLLEGVGGVPKYNLPDGIHPNEEGHKIIYNKLLKVLEKE
jgi:acyl-CoA thioesterase-1